LFLFDDGDVVDAATTATNGRQTGPAARASQLSDDNDSPKSTVVDTSSSFEGVFQAQDVVVVIG
jgi:hypothetical protein